MAAPPLVRLRLSGGFAAFVGDRELSSTELGSRRGRLLLQLLCAARGGVVVTDDLVAELWPAGAPQRPDAAVAVLVSRLRRVLGPAAILGRRGSYQLAGPPVVELDLMTAERLLVEARERLHWAPGLAASAAASALALLGDEALPAERYASWAAGIRTAHAGLVEEGRHLASAAALATGDVATALAVAQAAADADPLDERAHRDLMVAWEAAGQRAQALTVYSALRRRLADELGVDPAEPTQQAHLAILRSQRIENGMHQRDSEQSAPPAGADRRGDRSLPGRAEESALLERFWDEASTGRARLVLVCGESGIGKTALAQQAAGVGTRTGGLVLTARCYPTARSLFLQPVVDALEPALEHQPAAVRADLVDAHAPALSELFPALTRGAEPLPGSSDVRRRRTFDAVVEVVLGLSRRAPVLLVLDDLHEAGESTTAWLEHLVRHAEHARLLVVATVRVEHQNRVRELVPLSERLELGPLTPEVVGRLALEAGVGHVADEIARRSAGHPFYAVELIRAALGARSEVPGDLRSAVLDRIDRMGPDLVSLLRGAAVMGSAVEPEVLTRLLDRTLGWTTTACEAALTARLLAVVGQRYDFSHDLVREVLYDSIPEPTRVALHRRAATVLVGHPESVARHAAAAGDHAQAARAGLQAAEAALRRLTPADAVVLASEALAAAQAAGQPDLCGRALLVRAIARERAAGFVDALGDLHRARAAARSVGDTRLEMHVLRHLGGDIASAVGQPVGEYEAPLHEALTLATAIGDRSMEAELLGRLAILQVGRLRFTTALELGERAVAVAEIASDDEARAAALDGCKAALAYLGETERLAAVVAELEPLLRRAADPWRLPWLVFESAFIPLGRGHLARATAGIDEAIALCHRYGYPSYVPWFLTHRAWVARLAGDAAGAVADGGAAVELAAATPHTWWDATALAVHATTLLALGDRTAAIQLLERAVPLAESADADAYRLRVLAPLAEATGSADHLARATELLTQVEAPAGSAWILGADAYLCLARAQLAAARPHDAAASLQALQIAVDRLDWQPLQAPVASLASQIRTATAVQRGGRG